MGPAFLEWFWPVVSAASGALGAYAAIRTELRWLRSDVDLAHRRIDGMQALRTGKRAET